MNLDADPKPKKLHGAVYVLGGLAFIPLVGMLFGVLAILWGLLTRKRGGKLLAAIGAGGIAFTIILYGSLIYFNSTRHGGTFDKVKAMQAQVVLDTLVQSIEFYKIQRGTYPESLEMLRNALPKESFLFIFDFTDAKVGGHPRYFFYQREGKDHYFLRSVGPDGQPFTADDIVPRLSSERGDKVGLLLERQPDKEKQAK